MPASLKSQIQERANRKRRRIVQMFGMPTRPGTKTRQSTVPTGEPGYVLIPRKPLFEEVMAALRRGRLGRFLRPRQKNPEGQVLPEQERKE